MGSTIALPDDYVVVDLETTGLDPKYDDIIEISAIKFRNGIELDSFNQLVSIDYCVPYYITDLTGITDDMLRGCPHIEEAIKDFYNFIGEDIIIGHNINFDVHFLAHALKLYMSKDFTNQYVDTMRIARKLFPSFEHHRLSDIAAHYSISYEGAHRSKVDCDITNACYRCMRDEILANETEQDFQNRFTKHPQYQNRRFEKMKSIKEFQSANVHIDPSNPLYQKCVVFTGTLHSLSRDDAIQLAIDRGATVKTSVSKNTNYLVVGKQDVSIVGLDGMSTKEERAHEINRSGKAQISIISEEEFLNLAQVGGILIIC